MNSSSASSPPSGRLNIANSVAAIRGSSLLAVSSSGCSLPVAEWIAFQVLLRDRCRIPQLCALGFSPPTHRQDPTTKLGALAGYLLSRTVEHRGRLIEESRLTDHHLVRRVGRDQ